MTISKLVGSLMIYGLLTAPLCGYAQTSKIEEASDVIFQSSAQTVDLSPVDGNYSTDMHQSECHKFNAMNLILPGAMMTVGVFGIKNKAFRKLNTEIKNGMDNLRGGHFFHADDYIQYFPAVAYLTLGSVGIKSKHSIKERVAVEATAYMTMAALTNAGKYAFNEKRPDSNAKNSFPSGHTATVFTGAELIREEYGLGFGIGAYSIAVGVAFLRLYNGRHWLNDVIAGAGVGILSARIGCWMLQLYRQWFKWDNSSSNIIAISPGYDYKESTFSVNLAYTF
ncbi:phosphatase PAP2 family protein [uncultured Duncaniella sp.]|uniref:phosphatase PAP2 family protein n=1 Tax=uncultured Duncaniella sp. TaxID=2768039 RepID=UPI0025E4F76D|nr:phosphatase PAP2 family protein [uncultured Duncaniella sp.]